MRVLSPHLQASTEQIDVQPAVERSFADYLLAAALPPRVVPRAASLAVETALAIVVLPPLLAAESGLSRIPQMA
jgi:hypothetical protein